MRGDQEQDAGRSDGGAGRDLSELGRRLAGAWQASGRFPADRAALSAMHDDRRIGSLLLLADNRHAIPVLSLTQNNPQAPDIE